MPEQFSDGPDEYAAGGKQAVTEGAYGIPQALPAGEEPAEEVWEGQLADDDPSAPAGTVTQIVSAGRDVTAFGRDGYVDNRGRD